MQPNSLTNSHRKVDEIWSLHSNGLPTVRVARMPNGLSHGLYPARRSNRGNANRLRQMRRMQIVRSLLPFRRSGNRRQTKTSHKMRILRRRPCMHQILQTRGSAIRSNDSSKLNEATYCRQKTLGTNRKDDSSTLSYVTVTLENLDHSPCFSFPKPSK